MAQLGKKTCQITEVLKQTEGLSMSQPVNQRRIHGLNILKWGYLAKKSNTFHLTWTPSHGTGGTF